MDTRIVGILNYTPDSFSDSGTFFDLKGAMARIEEMFQEGADIVDIGANSTSYHKTILTADEEWNRVKLLLKTAALLYGYALSFDTFYPQNAQKAIDFGICMINDVGGAKDYEMRKVILQNPHIQYVFMYSLVLPANKNVRVQNKQEIYNFGKETLMTLIEQGIESHRLIFDPGIGFSTNTDLSFEIISDIAFLKELEIPIYIGHSRKSFLTNLAGLKPRERDIETLAASLHMALCNIDYLRVHNVAMHSKALNVWRKLKK